ncbi:MAG: NAD-dependent malic enzyme [Thermoproteota archaeon]|nr:MAG: NAD-dependent malic enzyme [Candidatus Korarchaeota archaeon]
MSDVYQRSVELHKKNNGKIKLESKIKVENNDDLSLVYTPGVAQVSREIAQNVNKSFELTWRGDVVAIVSDGSAVLGLGNIGPEAGLPVMEGKAMLMQRFGGVSAVPIVTNAHSADELVDLVTKIAPSFGAINLEDIASPICLEVEDRLQDIGIPVFHDDQHGTAIVVSAAIRNGAKVVGKKYEELVVVVSGAGAAGLAITQMLLGIDRVDGELIKVDGASRVKEVRLVDSKGVLSVDREGMNSWKEKFVKVTNESNMVGSLADGMKGADVLVGVSAGGIVTKKMVEGMASDSMVLAMANPEPEITPELAREAGAVIIGTGRSDYPNQVNNSLAFPGIFKGLLESRATKITIGVKQRVSEVLASLVEPVSDKILPTMFDEGVAKKIADAVVKQIEKEGLGRV